MALPAIRTEVKRLLIIALWAAFGFGYFSRFPLPDFFSKTYLLVLASLVTGSAWGWGSLFIPARLSTELAFEEELVFRTGAGFGILSLFMFAAGLFGLWTRYGALALVVFGLLIAWRQM